jgi:release factor glutamine methyltransferase
LIVDLCTGSGALAVALARQTPTARVIGVDISADALAYARRNSVGTSVELRHGDVTDPRLGSDLDGRVALVVANPPYLPDAVELEPEVAEHDPHLSLFGGPDGTAFVAAIASLAARWLVEGGLLAIEHDDTASAATRALLRGTGHFDDIEGHPDLTGRPRFVTARRSRY